MPGEAKINRLRVAHWSKDASLQSQAVLTVVPATEGLVIDTCLRRAVVWLASEPAQSNAQACESAPDYFSGRAAYRLLLLIATGLKSSVPGETNVFGQCQNAWREFTMIGDAQAVNELEPIMARLFVDTKEIRARWLEGAGGTSYGSVVRRMIRARRADRILFAGAGNLMRSMLPMFRRFPIGVWNHRASSVNPGFEATHFSPEAGEMAALWSNHIVLTTPADVTNDRNWQRWINAARPKTVTHLGQRQGQRFDLDFECELFNLDDVFSFRDCRQALRTTRVKGARQECFDRANLIAGQRVPTKPFSHDPQLVAA